MRNQEDADTLLESFGDQFAPLIFDVTDYEAVDKAALELKERVGEEGLGALINNAGIAVAGPMLEIKMDDLKYQFDVNVFGLTKVTQAFAGLLGARENHSSSPGRIIQIPSVNGRIAPPFMGPYSGSKHVVEGISDSLRRELSLYGIKVVIVQPGPIKTPIWEKSSDESLYVDFLKGPYAESMMIFRNVFMGQAEKHALSSEWLAEQVVKIHQKPNPKNRYAFVPKRFQNWTMPRLLPSKTLDGIIAKSLKLRKK